MKHVSKFDGCIYEIGDAMSQENGKVYSDDITLIWKDLQNDVDESDVDIPIREFINWYCGEYDYEDTEWYIKEHYKKKLEASKQPKSLNLSVAYVHLIQDCLQTIQKHDLYKLLGCYDGNEDDAFLGALKLDVDYVLKGICKPLDELDKDVKIILEVE